MQVFIHIGTNKTGTTAFQSYALKNRKALELAGLLYPKTGLGEGTAGPEHHYRLARALANGGPAASEMCADLAAELSKSRAGKAILSSEFFVDVTRPGPLAEGLKEHDCKVIVYLRRHDFWVDSMFNQAIKMTRRPQWKPDIEDFIRDKKERQSHWFSFARLLQTWSSAFGKENVIVRPYRSLQRMDIHKEILDLGGVERAALPPPHKAKRAVNGSLSRRQLAAIDFFQRSDMPDEHVRDIIQQVIRHDDSDRPRSLMPAHVAAALVCDNAEDYAMIAREYLGRADGILFDEPMPKMLNAEDDVGPLDPEEGMAILAELVAARQGLLAA